MNTWADVALDRTCRRPAAGVTREGWVSAGPVIAVIDDDASMRTALVKLFRSLGYDVVYNGEETPVPNVVAAGAFPVLSRISNCRV